MKRIVLLCVFSLMVTICNSQEWIASFDVAKRLASVQNKMLFVLWEGSFEYSNPVSINFENGVVSVVDISKDTSLDAFIQEYFILVKLSESEYDHFIKEASGRGYKYVNKLNDNSIKIMDFNGVILNMDDTSEGIVNLSLLIKKYALNTSFLKSELEQYSVNHNFMTASLLGMRYIDFAMYADEQLRPELIALATIYLDESERFLSQMEDDRKEAYLKKIELVKIKGLLILNTAKKAYRQIKKIDESQIDAINESLFAFLNYTVFKLLDDEMNADLWKSKISSLDLKMAELIIKNNKDGSAN
jgi:hypothetical protein